MVGRAIALAVAALLAGVLMLFALAYLSIAFYLWLATLIAPPYAALSVAGAALLLTVLVLLVVRLRSPSRRKRKDRLEEALEEAVGEGPARSILELMKRHGLEAAAAALAAGFALGASRRLRGVLRSLLKL